MNQWFLNAKLGFYFYYKTGQSPRKALCQYSKNYKYLHFILIEFKNKYTIIKVD